MEIDKIMEGVEDEGNNKTYEGLKSARTGLRTWRNCETIRPMRD